jgi:hypothetical protein
MWALQLFPDNFLLFIVNCILVLGIVGTFFSFVILNRILRFFPPLANYYRAFQVISVVLLLSGVYLKGVYGTEMAWRERVAEVEAKLKIAEEKSNQANVKIVTKVVKQLELVRTRGDDIIKYVDREVVKDKEVIKFVENCPIPQAIINTHNAAALNKSIEANK